jgi:hypothetical protein
MNENLQNAIDFSNKMLRIKTQKKYLAEKFSADTTFGYQGGLFKIDSHLLVFVRSLIIEGKIRDVILIDSNGNPIVIPDLKDFENLIKDRYWSAVGFYQAGYEDLKNQKNNILRVMPKE